MRAVRGQLPRIRVESGLVISSRPWAFSNPGIRNYHSAACLFLGRLALSKAVRPMAFHALAGFLDCSYFNCDVYNIFPDWRETIYHDRRNHPANTSSVACGFDLRDLYLCAKSAVYDSGICLDILP